MNPYEMDFWNSILKIVQNASDNFVKILFFKNLKLLRKFEEPLVLESNVELHCESSNNNTHGW